MQQLEQISTMNFKTGSFLIMALLIPALTLFGQLYKVSGKVFDNNNEPVSLASVEVKELKKGLVTKDDGSYEFFLERGKYDLVISIIGYKTKILTVYVNNQDVVENITMEPDEGENLSEVVIRAKIRDRAEEIIRNVIRNKETVLNAIGSYSCNVYIRAFQLDSSKSLGKNEPYDTNFSRDFADMSMTEVSLHLDKSSDGRVKEERVGVNKNGSTESLFYLSTTEGDFYIYGNLIHAPPVSKIPFVSPLSYSGLLAYRFKTLKIDRDKKPREYTISIRPRQLSNATVEGEIVIQDSTWAVLSVRFRLPQAHMPEYDFMEVIQEYEKVGDSARMISRQKFNYYTKTKNGRLQGETIAVYSDYQLNKNFGRGHFGNEVSTTTLEAYEKDSSFWYSVRREPLSRQQELYSRYRDSINRLMKSEAYLDSIDRVLNKITWKNMLVFGQIFNDHKKERMWIIPPITSLVQPISFGGVRLRLAGAYRKTFTDRKDLKIGADISYGFRNHDVNGMLLVERLYNPFTRGKYWFKTGRNFEFIYSGDAWINVLKRSNIYLNNSLEANHEIQLFNGIMLYNKLEIAFRRSVSDYKVGNNTDSIFGIPNEPAVAFDPYNATYGEIKIYYTPAQKFIREPYEKIILGSKWPTFYVDWLKGIPNLFKSKIDFSYLEFGMQQKINLGVSGNTSYILKSGKFLDTTDLRIIDYRYMRQGDPLLFLNPEKALQALDSTFPVFDRYFQGNLVHEFNGLFINKIPFMKKLKLQEIAGGGLLIVPERDLRYVEFFAGLERVFKWPFNPLARIKLGVYVVGSVANKFNNPVQFKIGLTTWDRFKNRWR